MKEEREINKTEETNPRQGRENTENINFFSEKFQKAQKMPTQNNSRNWSRRDMKVRKTWVNAWVEVDDLSECWSSDA